MADQPRAPHAPFTTETVWDAGLAGTGCAGEGLSLTMGPGGDWVPEQLLLLAAEGGFMSTLLALAEDAGITLLGYVSKGRLEVAADPTAARSIVLSACAVVRTPQDAQRLSALADQAKDQSPIARMLGGRVTVALDVRAVPVDASG